MLTLFTRRLPNSHRPHLKNTASLVCLLLAVAAPGAIPATAQAQSVNSARYVIGADDVLSVTVLKHPEFSVSSVTVPQNGSMSFPVVGTLRVNGKTLQQLDAAITQGLRSKLRNPEVTITLDKPRPRPIYIVGQVKSPGIYEVKSGWRITQALAAAGGLSVDTDLSAVIVNRNNKKLLDTSLLPLLKDPTNRSNLVLQTGDSLRFYERKVTVSVTGAVNKPGIYAVPVGSGIVQAIGFAGGSTADAALTRASLRRASGQIVPLNLYSALRENDADSNVPLIEGDVIVVPEQKDRISVLGAVPKPGFFGLQDGRDLKVADAIALAGGPDRNAALTQGILRRADGTQQTINLYSLLIEGEQTDNIKLRPDDIISIPEARGIKVIGEVAAPGSYPLEMGTNPQVSDAIAAAGGLKVKPELASISLSRTLDSGKNVTLSVDAVGLLRLSDLSQNARLRDGDILSVTANNPKLVFISGEIVKPGAYEIAEKDGVTELISRAGGPTNDAALSQVAVTGRDGTRTTVDTVAALLEGSERAGKALSDGDSIVIPRSKLRFLIEGAVGQPGSYALPENRPLTLGGALSLAGGTQNTGRVKSVTLLRPTGQEGKDAIERMTLALDKPDKNGRLALNMLIQDGDVIYAPEGKPRQSTLENIYRFLPGAALFLR